MAFHGATEVIKQPSYYYQLSTYYARNRVYVDIFNIYHLFSTCGVKNLKLLSTQIIWFGYFNCISNLVDNLIPKLFLYKNNSDTI